MTQKAGPAAVQVAAKHRLVCLQPSSIFETYGGVEYYLDDNLTLASELYPSNVRTVIASRRERRKLSRPYKTSFVDFSKNRWLQKFQNRFSPTLLTSAMKEVRDLKPTMLVNGHVNLGPLVYLIHRLTGIPYITFTYGIECWGHLFPQDEWCLRKSAAIISISHWTKQILVRRGFAQTRIHVVHPMLDYSYENLLVTRAPDRPFTLLTISRLDATEQYKGQDHVLEALALMLSESPTLRLRYVIQGEGSDKARLENLVKARGLEAVVEFRGKVGDRSELLSLYREADLYVMPSRFGRWEGRWKGEGFGIVYVEAAATGLPSVAYRCGGAMDIIVDGKTGILVEPEDIRKLADALLSLYEDRERLAKLGAQAHQHVNKNFTRPAIIDELTRCLNSF